MVLSCYTELPMVLLKNLKYYTKLKTWEDETMIKVQNIQLG